MVLDKLPKLKVTFKQLSKQDVLTGVPEDKTARKDTDKEGMTNAALAYINDQGSPANNIPAREFMRPGVEAVKEKIADNFAYAARKAAEGDSGAIDKALNRVGLLTQASIRGKINAGIDPALSPRTLYARRKRGRLGDKPLVDTAQLRNSINYVIRNKK